MKITADRGHQLSLADMRKSLKKLKKKIGVLPKQRLINSWAEEHGEKGLKNNVT